MLADPYEAGLTLCAGCSGALLLGANEDQISFIPTPSGIYDPPSGIDLIYLTGNVGLPVLSFPGLTNADFQWVEDAIIFG